MEFQLSAQICFFLLLSFSHSMAYVDSSQFTMTERLIFRKYISLTATSHPLLKTKTSSAFTQPEASYHCQHTLTLFWHVGFLLITKDDAELSEESLVCGKQVCSVFQIPAKVLRVINSFIPPVKRVHILNYHIIPSNPWHNSTVMLPLYSLEQLFKDIWFSKLEDVLAAIWRITYIISLPKQQIFCSFSRHWILFLLSSTCGTPDFLDIFGVKIKKKSWFSQMGSTFSVQFIICRSSGWSKQICPFMVAKEHFSMISDFPAMTDVAEQQQPSSPRACFDW